MAVNPSEGVCFPRGFVAGIAAAGIKREGTLRPDVAVVFSTHPCLGAGVFTRNAVKAAPILVSQGVVRGESLRAVILNSGNANACTGEQGLRDAQAMSQAAASALSVSASEVAVCSTGVIGRPMPMDRVIAAVETAVANVDHSNGLDAAQAIMTTDTVPKQAAATVTVGAAAVRIGAMAKGSGMIHPDMATMLAVITTDAPLERAVLQPMLQRVADFTFNCTTVDTDTSTNDTVLLLANGASSSEPLKAGELEAFESALLDVCDSLCEQMVADAEGATKYFRVLVDGAADASQARLAARTVAASPLVKTAIHGADPNWGRIIAALGRSGAQLNPTQCRIAIGGVVVFNNGAPAECDLQELSSVLRATRTDIECHLGVGEGSGHAWGCDLSAEYVRINADYTT